MSDWDKGETARYYRKLAADSRKRAAELMVEGSNSQLARETIAGLLRDARDNEEIAKTYEDPPKD